ncbi:uncharacterized protein LOC128816560 [Vidua macroura]|uniref:uncharacterized protein LOC128816560 n=1 Tax=Vidua macroura TaxID=187451 RepID=UPI0023A8F109|nr:uncharacterized protein LOC128816560 [Vidua macroura]XP_053850240.1 uncharacterized protein LOC128816560 [Vidua macroura]XP_053850241.1 uncharacterized protein LOC128816560 [Vidua macroura]XP_053850242.1 uncharacterized protein LOC128816560 [Vidua macroura]XP_053850243.1 uncharacterized protein LOC128816560 [Vidua macroura]XP_053850244.1 uncharacterized protein LOC128816560 [Vidua macroura]XP_053850245.1 uncharacterized protein LOC128816560 [Vidua macroura]XP_053850246.1 uncharacterized p
MIWRVPSHPNHSLIPWCSPGAGGAVGSGWTPLLPQRGHHTPCDAPWNSSSPTHVPSPGLQGRTRRAKNGQEGGSAVGADHKRSCFSSKLLSSPPAQVLTAVRARQVSGEVWEGAGAAWHARGWHCLWAPWCCQCHQPWGRCWPRAQRSSAGLGRPQALPCLDFTANPALFRCGNDWILLDFFSLGDGQLRAGASRRFLTGSSPCPEGPGCPVGCPGCRMRLSAGSALGTALCRGGTFVLKGGRKGDNAQSPWQRGRDAGDRAVSWQRCWGAAEVSCPDPGLNSNISGSVGYLGGALLNLDAPSRI